MGETAPMRSFWTYNHRTNEVIHLPYVDGTTWRKGNYLFEGGVYSINELESGLVTIATIDHECLGLKGVTPEQIVVLFVEILAMRDVAKE